MGFETSGHRVEFFVSPTDCIVSGEAHPLQQVLPGDVMSEADGPEDKGPLHSNRWYGPWHTLWVPHECWQLTIQFWLTLRCRGEGTDTVRHAWKAVAGHRWNEPAIVAWITVKTVESFETKTVLRGTAFVFFIVLDRAWGMPTNDKAPKVGWKFVTLLTLAQEGSGVGSQKVRTA